MQKKAEQPLVNRLRELAGLYTQGRLEEVVRQGAALALEFPKSETLYNIIGAAHVGLKQPDAAVKNFRQAIRIRPGYADAYNNMGNALQDKGDFPAAIEAYRQAIKNKPDYAEAHQNMGNALQAQGNLPAAIKSYKAALEIRPDYADAHSNLGNAFRGCGNTAGALASYRRAVGFNPRQAHAWNNMGVVQQAQGDLAGAVESYGRALEIRPDYAEGHNNLGSALRDIGDIARALEHGRQAIRIKPDYAGAHRNLSLITKYTPDDPQINHMLQLAAQEDLSGKDRCQLCFALGKAYDDTGDTAKAFEWLSLGNKLRKDDLKYSIASDRELFARIKEAFSGGTDALPETDSGPKPVFIVGMPRSGTSLVEQILASHSDVYGAGELDFLRGSVAAAGWPSLALEGERLAQLRAAYLSGLSGLKVTEGCITDKMPINFRWLGFILTSLPEAKVIHTKRDARATCWSLFRQYFTPDSNGYAYDMDDLVAYYGMYVDLMSFWHEKFPGRIYDLSYQELTDDQEGETRKLLAHLGLGWEDQCLAFHETARAVQTASAMQVRRKMYRGSSGEWKKYAEYLGPMIEGLAAH